MTLPLVSCICLSQGELKLPVSCFKRQTYPKVELIVVHSNGGWVNRHDLDPGDDPAQYELVLDDENIHFVYVPPPKKTIGELYNLGVQNARGEFCIIWDSDDWHHPERIDQQLEATKKYINRCVMLSQLRLWDFVNSRPYLSQKRQWEGTLLAPRHLFKRYPYPAKSYGGDTNMVVALGENEGGIGVLEAPELYIYGLHDQNSSGREHGEALMAWGTELSAEDDNFGALFDEAQRFELPIYKPSTTEVPELHPEQASAKVSGLDD